MEMPPASAMEARSCNWSINSRNTKTMPEILGDTGTPPHVSLFCRWGARFPYSRLSVVPAGQLEDFAGQTTLWQGRGRGGGGGWGCSNGNVLIQQKKKNNSSKG